MMATDYKERAYWLDKNNKLILKDPPKILLDELPCGFRHADGDEDEDHYIQHVNNTLRYLLSEETGFSDTYSDHCHLDGRSHDLGGSYCGIYEREVDQRLESAFDTIELDECDSCDELEYDLESYEKYSADYDRNINTWTSFALVDLSDVDNVELGGSREFLATDEFGFEFDTLTASNLTLNDIDFANDNVPQDVNKQTTNQNHHVTNLSTNHGHSFDKGQGHDKNDNLSETRLQPSSLCSMQIIKNDNAKAMANLIS